MRKFKVKTDALLPFCVKEGDVIEQNEENGLFYRKDKNNISAGIAPEIIEKIPEWFEEIKEDWHWPGRYEPEKGTGYYALSRLRQEIIRATNVNKKDMEQDILLGISGETQKEIEFVVRQKAAYLELIAMIKELNEGWRPDWKNGGNLKFSFCYDWEDEKILISQGIRGRTQNFPSCLYGKSTLVLKETLDRLGEEKIKLALWLEYKEA